MTSLRHERAHQFGSKWPPKWEACKQQLSQDVLSNNTENRGKRAGQTQNSTEEIRERNCTAAKSLKVGELKENKYHAKLMQEKEAEKNF